MKRIISKGRFLYEHNGKTTQCLCDVILRDDNRYYVVFTEREDNANVSITNSIESVCNTLLECRPEITPNNVVFLERYESHPDYLDRVQFAEYDQRYKRVKNPTWSRLAQPEANDILSLIDSPV